MSLQWFLLGGKRKLFLIFTQKALKCHPKFLSLKNEWGPKHLYELLFTVVGAGRLNNKESVSNMSSHPLKSGRLTRACDELPLAKRIKFCTTILPHTHTYTRKIPCSSLCCLLPLPVDCQVLSSSPPPPPPLPSCAFHLNSLLVSLLPLSISVTELFSPV